MKEKRNSGSKKFTGVISYGENFEAEICLCGSV